jgi:hypothetical protein
MVGLLLPFLTQPKTVAGKHIILQVDNTAVVHGWRKKYTTRDPETSLLLRSLHVLENYLECKIYVEYLRRVSDHVARVADSLSRETTTTPAIRTELAELPWHRVEGHLLSWLENPVLDWALPMKLVEDVKKLMSDKQ